MYFELLYRTREEVVCLFDYIRAFFTCSQSFIAAVVVEGEAKLTRNVLDALAILKAAVLVCDGLVRRREYRVLAREHLEDEPRLALSVCRAALVLMEHGYMQAILAGFYKWRYIKLVVVFEILVIRILPAVDKSVVY